MDVTCAEFAGHFHSQVFRGNSQFLRAVRAVHVERFRTNSRVAQVEFELTAAKFARNSLTLVLPTDAQLLIAVRAHHVVASEFDFGHGADFLKFKELRDLNIAAVEIRIQERSTELAVNQVCRHVLSAVGTVTTGPCTHKEFLGLSIWGSEFVTALSQSHRSQATEFETMCCPKNERMRKKLVCVHCFRQKKTNERDSANLQTNVILDDWIAGRVASRPLQAELAILVGKPAQLPNSVSAESSAWVIANSG